MRIAHQIIHRWNDSFTRYPWWLVPVFCWVVMIVIVAIRVHYNPDKGTVYPTFATAGHAFAAGQNIYGKGDALFRYAPVWAAFFSAGNDLPPFAASMSWRLLNLLVLVWGAVRFQEYFFPHWTNLQRALWWVLLLPFCQGSFNNAQANLLVLGLLMAGITSFAQRRFWLTGLCLSVTISMKVYPISLALLLMLLKPVAICIPLCAWLVFLGLAPFLFQSSHYITSTYQQWVQFSFGDLRIDKDLSDSNRDVWMLIRLTRLPIDYRVYQLLQAGSALILAGWTWYQREAFNHDHTSRRYLLQLFNLATAWMLVFGPASESSTYALYAPFAAWSMMQFLTAPLHRTEQWLSFVSFLLMLTAHLGSAFTYTAKLHAWGIHPIAAIVLAITVHILLKAPPDRQTLPSLTYFR